ncbi:hypothetical protein BV097_00589 [Haemophilus influenzae]|nr:hypothetical protein BV094_01481 [Haemophilus influenzae]PRJ56126.1 hypothetical protein BV097_00589 [Haemophilus influenzae]
METEFSPAVSTPLPKEIEFLRRTVASLPIAIALCAAEPVRPSVAVMSALLPIAMELLAPMILLLLPMATEPSAI